MRFGPVMLGGRTAAYTPHSNNPAHANPFHYNPWDSDVVPHYTTQSEVARLPGFAGVTGQACVTG